MKNNINIGNIIKYFRNKNGISQSLLADLVGVDRSEISKIENNIRKNPNEELLKRICSTLNINYAKLLETSKKNNEKAIKKYKVTKQETFKTSYIVPAENEKKADEFVNNFYKLADVLECKITKECEYQTETLIEEVEENNTSRYSNEYILIDEVDLLL